MAKAPWITIVGLGEDGPEGLSAASLNAISAADVIMGAKRHLSLLGDLTGERIEWPVPFSDGIPLLASQAGRRVAVLASGDPFWFGAGAAIAREFDAADWCALPAPSTFSVAANRLGWSLEQTLCFGLHAAPLSRLRPYLAPTARCLVLLRDGDAVQELGHYLTKEGFGESTLSVMQALGGPRERIVTLAATDIGRHAFEHPVCAAFQTAGSGAVVPLCSGIADDLFETDGVMTKRPIRAVTLSSLAPVPGEMLWDIGGGSGSVAIEWLLAHPRCEAIAIEPRVERVAMMTANAARLGVDRLQVVSGAAPDALGNLPIPDAVFIGGGLSAELLEALWHVLPAGTRIVANAVTLEAEALLTACLKTHGGELLRLEVAMAQPLGAKTAWKSSYPLVQWSGVI